MNPNTAEKDSRDPARFPRLRGLSAEQLLRYTRSVSPPPGEIPIPHSAPHPLQTTEIYLTEYMGGTEAPGDPTSSPSPTEQSADETDSEASSPVLSGLLTRGMNGPRNLAIRLTHIALAMPATKDHLPSDTALIIRIISGEQVIGQTEPVTKSPDLSVWMWGGSRSTACQPCFRARVRCERVEDGKCRRCSDNEVLCTSERFGEWLMEGQPGTTPTIILPQEPSSFRLIVLSTLEEKILGYIELGTGELLRQAAIQRIEFNRQLIKTGPDDPNLEITIRFQAEPAKPQDLKENPLIAEIERRLSEHSNIVGVPGAIRGATNSTGGADIANEAEAGGLNTNENIAAGNVGEVEGSVEAGEKGDTTPKLVEGPVQRVIGETDSKWTGGIQWPTREEFESITKKYQYTQGYFHFAITGASGSGRSSLINAFRGLKQGDQGSCPTGVVATPEQVSRYSDPNHERCMWYDIPDTHSLSIPGPRYFIEQGLYIFDFIIIVYNNRPTAADLAILRNCQLYKTPSYLVRSKSDEHIQNHMKTMPDYDSDIGNHDGQFNSAMWLAARDEYSAETRREIEKNLNEANLDPQTVYLVSRDTLLAIVTAESEVESKKPVVDEYNLLRDLRAEISARLSVS